MAPDGRHLSSGGGIVPPLSLIAMALVVAQDGGANHALQAYG
jgi:hypothetical protein